MPNLLIPVLLALAAGASVVTQQALNANLRTALNSAAWSGFVSYAVGVVCMGALAVALRDGPPTLAVAARIPWWAWSGGLFGALFIGLGIFLVPKLGAATFIALLIAGQMLTSVTFDHFGLLGLPQRSVDLPRLLGVVLLVAGVVLIRREPLLPENPPAAAGGRNCAYKYAMSLHFILSCAFICAMGTRHDRRNRSIQDCSSLGAGGLDGTPRRQSRRVQASFGKEPHRRAASPDVVARCGAFDCRRRRLDLRKIR